MTYLSTSRARSAGLWDRLTAFAAGLSEGAGRRRVFNRTVSELSQLTDRELADLGIHRAMISQIAAEAAGIRT